MDKQLESIMQTEVIGLNAESTLADSLRLMKSSGMSHLIVRSDNNELLGIISKRVLGLPG